MKTGAEKEQQRSHSTQGAILRGDVSPLAVLRHLHRSDGRDSVLARKGSPARRCMEQLGQAPDLGEAIKGAASAIGLQERNSRGKIDRRHWESKERNRGDGELLRGTVARGWVNEVRAERETNERQR